MQSIHVQAAAGLTSDLDQVSTLRFDAGPFAKAPAHDFSHGHEVIAVASLNAAALDLVTAVMLLCRKPVNKDHLGGNSIAALNMTDVIALDSPWRCGQFKKLSEIFIR